MEKFIDEKIENHIRKCNFYIHNNKKVLLLNDRFIYIVRYNSKVLKCMKRFDTIEQAREYRDLANLHIAKAKYVNLKNKQTKEIDTIPFCYPDNLLYDIGINDSNTKDFYTKVIPNFVDNYDNISNKYLNDRERLAINMYYNRNFNQEKVGSALKVGRERARQIIKKAVNKLSAFKQVFLDSPDKYEIVSEEIKKQLIDNIKQQMSMEIALEIVKEKYDVVERGNKDLKIFEVGFSNRTINSLLRFGIQNTDQLYEYIQKNGISSIYSIGSIGVKSAREIIHFINTTYGTNYENISYYCATMINSRRKQNEE